MVPARAGVQTQQPCSPVWSTGAFEIDFGIGADEKCRACPIGQFPRPDRWRLRVVTRRSACGMLG